MIVVDFLSSVRWFWGPFLLVAFVLFLVAKYFTARTLRITTLFVLAVTAGLMVWLGTHPANRPPTGSGKPTLLPNPLAAFADVFDKMADAFWSPLYGLRSSGHTMNAGGWIVMLLALGAGYLALELRSAKHDSPRVDVDNTDKADKGTVTGEIADELSFRLPAVELRKPSTVPGTGKDITASVAAVVEASGVEGGNLVGEALRLLHIKPPTPRSFSVKVHAEKCGDRPDGKVAPSGDGRNVNMTVDLREQKTGRSVCVKTFTEVPRSEAAARAAGFVATRLFKIDPSAPPWTVGFFDGEDLAAYLVDQQPERVSRTYGEVRQDRCKRIERMEKVNLDGPASGMIRYELGELYELEGQEVKALRLYALNRAQHECFYRGRYRFAGALSMLAGPSFDYFWRRPDEVEVRKDIHRYLQEAGLDPDQDKDVWLPPRDAFVDPHNQIETALRRSFAQLAAREFDVYRRRLNPLQLVKEAWHRKYRSSLWPYLKNRTLRRNEQRLAEGIRELAVARARTLEAKFERPYVYRLRGIIWGKLATFVNNERPGYPPRQPLRVALQTALTEIRAGHPVAAVQILETPVGPRDAPLEKDRAARVRELEKALRAELEDAVKRMPTGSLGEGLEKLRAGQLVEFTKWLTGEFPEAVQAARQASAAAGHRSKGVKRGDDDWRVIYNLACFSAMDLAKLREDRADPERTDPVLRDVIDLLQMAIDSQYCQLRRPSEWIGVDPDLHHLRGERRFDELVEDQLRHDFARPMKAEDDTNPSDTWLEDRVKAALPPLDSY